MTEDDIVQAGEAEGFEVMDGVNIGSLDDVKEQRPVAPPARDIKLLITEAKPVGNKEKTWLGVNCAFKIIDGINAGTEEEPKLVWKNGVIFYTIAYYADPTIYTKDFFTAKNRPYLVDWKGLAEATGYDEPSNPGTDKMFEFLKNKMVIGNITQNKETRKNEEGVRVPTGGVVNEVKNLKKVPDEELV